MTESIFIGADNVIVIDQLRYARTGNFANNATVTANLLDADGVSLSNPTGEAHGSGGRYYIVIPSTVTANLTINQLMSMEITANTGDETMVWKFPVRGAYAAQTSQATFRW